jgi:hypothetical protein
VLRLLERWPTQEQLAGATREELVAFAHAAHHGWPERLADRVQEALGHAHFLARPALVRAKAQSIRLAARQLLRITEPLLGAPSHEPGEQIPGGEVSLSFPGLGDRLAARR